MAAYEPMNVSEEEPDEYASVTRLPLSSDVSSVPSGFVTVRTPSLSHLYAPVSRTLFA